jgi:putative ABC transport system substrate-binding protein
MINVGDPVAEGLVQSLARPGRNITGVSLGRVAMTVIGVGLPKTVMRRLARLVILADLRAPNSLFPSTAQQFALNLSLDSRSVDVQTVQDVDNDFQMMQVWNADGLIVEGASTYVSGVNARVGLAAE